MIGQGKLIGGALIVLGVGIAFILTLWAFANQGSEGLTGGSVALVAGCGIFLGLILAGAGVFFFMSGRSESAQFAEVEKQRMVLNAVSTRGEVRIAELALEQNLTVDQIKRYVYDLVGKGLFTGFVDWKGGRLISRDAADLTREVNTSGKCANCGAPLNLGGKGLIKCEYCGAEYFLSPDAAGGASTPAAS